MKQSVYDPTNSRTEITVAWNVTPEVTILHFVTLLIFGAKNDKIRVSVDLSSNDNSQTYFAIILKLSAHV